MKFLVTKIPPSC